MSRLLLVVALFATGLVQLIGALIAASSVMAWQTTNPFHYTRDPMMLRLETPELVLTMGVLAYALATVPLVAILEARLATTDRGSRSAALGLLPIAGIVAFFLCSTDVHLPHVAKPKDQGQPISAAIGIGFAMLTLIGGVVFIYHARKPRASEATISAAAANRRAYSVVRELMRAQSEYIKRDWDGDGEYEHALFVVHLWRTARLKNAPVEVGLISEELAVSRVEDFAYNDYTYRNLHQRALDDGKSSDSPRAYKPRLRELNYAREWALIAEPVFGLEKEEEHERLQFIVVSNEGVFARKYKYDLFTFVPFELEKKWSRISSLEDVARLQAKSAQ